MVCPRRILTSTVRARYGMIPVRTDGEIKKSEIFRWMERIRAMRIDRDVKQGEVLLTDDDEGIRLIATASYRNEEGDNAAF